MQSLLNEPESNAWAQIAPLLDTALAGLGDKDRNAVVLRFFNGRKLGEVADRFGHERRSRQETGQSRSGRNCGTSSLKKACAGSGHDHRDFDVFGPGGARRPGGVGVWRNGQRFTLLLIKETLNRMLWIKLKTSIAAAKPSFSQPASLPWLWVKSVHHLGSKTRSETRMSNPWRRRRRACLATNPNPGPVNDAESGERFVGRNMLLRGLLCFLHGYPWWDRLVLPADAPQGRYDLLLTLTDNSREVLRQEIQRQLGLVAHREPRMADVLLLDWTPPKLHV